MSAQVLAIHHVQLAMPAGREQEARAFYQGILGIPEVPKPAHLAPRGGCWFERDNLRIHLGLEANFSPARKAHPALLVHGLDHLKTALRNAGYKPKPDAELEGYDRTYADDPFGNRIELMEARE